MTRRKFLGLMGAGMTAGAFVDPVWAAFELPSDELARWRDSLLTPGTPRVYLSDRHTDARMHLGGIGTGNVEIGADGQFLNWQLFNNLRDGFVPFCFAVKAGATAKLLQTVGGPDWPRVSRIEMTGEYPVATLRFRDDVQDDEYPVQLELEAFSPFAPLDSELSSWPLNLFRFRIHNPTSSPQVVSLAAMMLNPVGYAAIGKIQDCAHPNFGANINERFHTGRATGLFFRAEKGSEPTLDRPVTIYLPRDLFVLPPDPGVDEKNYASTSQVDIAIPPLDRPAGLEVKILDGNFSARRMPRPANSVIWLEDAPVNLSDSTWAEIKSAVVAGATLIFSGRTMPLLDAYAVNTGGQPRAEAPERADILFEDFEHGYGQWTVTGTAFGTEPAHGTLPDQQPVSGFLGHGLVNSYVNGDDATGKLISRDFVIERNFIRFLVGGGHYRTTQIRLLINGRVVRATSGRDNEQLEPAIWNVREFAGQTAHIEIVDEQKGGWGHINVDQIIFSDWSMSDSLIQTLGELLPLDFESIEPAQVTDETVSLNFRNPVLRTGTVQTIAENGLAQFARPFEAGKVVVLAGRVLNPARTDCSRERQNVFALLCALAGATYTRTTGQSAKDPGFGTMALAALAGDVTGLVSFDDWTEAWGQFQRNGRFPRLESASSPTPVGKSSYGALASTVTVAPGGTVEVPFLLAWHYPNKYGPAGDWIGCHYATHWTDARAVMRQAVAQYDALSKVTKLYRDTVYDSTLPYWLLDCLTANSGIIRHAGVVFRLAGGDIYGWEGSNGSCRPTCTHVWGYEQSLAHLFPDLEREMRALDYHHQQNPDGGINNRTDIPSPPHPTGEPPFTDGHASCILKAYREALNSSDESFFKDYWPPVKRAVEYLIARDVAGQSDGQPAGILQDDQRNTYDEALHGVTTFIGTYYLAALRAGEEWARRMGDAATADRYHAIFESGQRKLTELCWNGEYFQQHLPDYQQRWGEVGPGCMSDQLLGQWWAHQLGLGYLLPQKMVASAMAAVFKYNWKSDLTGWHHSPRAFAGAHDKGLIVCTWPKGGRPNGVLNYSDEVWTGIEYQVAAHLIYEGMVAEGLSIARGARERYDGLPRSPITRNPWCEIECGGHYTRAMSSWSLLLAVSGFQYDGPRGWLRFAPRCQPENFQSFFSTAEGWGAFTQKTEGVTRRVTISIKAGRLGLDTFQLDPLPGQSNPSATVHLGTHNVPVTVAVNNGQCEIHFAGHGVEINPSNSLEIILA